MELRVDKKLGVIVGVSTLAVGLLLIGFTVRRSMVHSATLQAHAQFMVRSDAYHKLAKQPSRDEQSALIGQLQGDYTQFSHTAYGPYFLALASDIMAELGDTTQARENLGTAMKHMHNNAPGLYYVYATKYALMQLDAEDPQLQVQGKQALEKLAHTPKNPHKDMALFYLGYRAFLEQDSPAVQAAWGKLFDQGRPTSHWGVRAHALLNYQA